MKKTNCKRDTSLDLLRTIGILAIILAHVPTPGVISQLRNFDVVLMVLLIGMVYRLTMSINSWKGYFSYILKRFKRLIIPSWCFLAIFFAFYILLKQMGVISGIYLVEDYVYSIFLISGQPDIPGIGFVWIIRVYFLVALVLPLLDWVRRSVGIKIYSFVLLGIYISYELLYAIVGSNELVLSNIFKWIVMYAIGYGLVSGIGLIVQDCHKKTLYGAAGVSLGVFICLMVVNHFQMTQIAKYPPRAYYLAYALFASFVLIIISKSLKLEPIKDTYAIQWCSKNSLWLYFWHIVPLKLIEWDVIILPFDNFIVRFFVVLLIAVVLTLCHNCIKKNIYSLIDKKQQNVN